MSDGYTLSERRRDELMLILDDVLYRLGFVWDIEQGCYRDTAATGMTGPLNRNPSETIHRFLEPDE